MASTHRIIFPSSVREDYGNAQGTIIIEYETGAVLRNVVEVVIRIRVNEAPEATVTTQETYRRKRHVFPVRIEVAE